MKCPNCSSGLSKMHYKDEEVDFCKSCKGAWFDSGELNSVIDKIVSSDEIPSADIDLDKTVISKYGFAEDIRSCPCCHSEMSKLNYAYDSNIFLDKCKSCQGMWADGDEIMKLAVFRKGNPVLDRMGKAIAQDRGKTLNERYSGSSSMSPYGRFAGSHFGFRIILPLTDDQERHRFPFVVLSILVMNIAIFLFQIIFFNGSGIRGFYNQFGLIPDYAFTSINGGYSFITSMFIHGGIWHLVGNMLFLWIFADNIEDRFGHLKFLILYLFFGFTASLVHIAFDSNSTIPCIGASGAISGTMGAYFVLYPSAKIKTYVYGGIYDIPALFYLGGWFALQITFAWLESNRIGGGVAWFAHIGGFAAGATVAAFLKYIEFQKKGRNPYTPTKNKDFDPKKV